LKYTASVFLILVCVLLSGCQEPPQATLERAEQAQVVATEARAPRFASGQFSYADSILNVGRLEMARQKGRTLPFMRDFAYADSLMLSSIQGFEAAQKVAVDSLATLTTAATVQVDALETDVTGWRDVLDSALILFRAETQWTAAQMGLMQAKELLAAGEFTEAMQQVDNTHIALTQLNRIFTDYTNSHNGHQKVWRAWAEETIANSRQNGSTAIIVDKLAHSTYLIKAGKIVKTYRSDLGYNSAVQKAFAGDGATPEGQYRVTAINNSSKFYRAMLIDYPNEADYRRFKENKKKGIIPARARIGKLIEFHGEGGQDRDWTDGCVAVTNHDMDDLIRQAGVGTPVTIVRQWERKPQE
jgi:L,D-peptidoglycan transpeptidase YkuD (ErfK/YbiS/YcfS/YnhG family)